MRRAAGLIFIALVATLPLTIEGVSRQWTVVLILASVATALNLISGLAGQISLGHAALMGVGAYAVAYFTGVSGWEPVAGLVISALAGAAAGLLMGLPSLRVGGQFLALTTIGGGFIFRAVIGETDQLGGVSGMGGIPPLSLFGKPLSLEMHGWIAWVFMVIVVLGADAITRSRKGRALAAIKDSEAVAASVGVDVPRDKLMAFVLSAAVSGMAGGLLAFSEGFVSREAFDLSLSLALLIACVIGGLGRPVGGAVGALVLLGPFVLWPQIEAYRLLVLGPLALGILYWAPDGAAGLYSKARGLVGLASIRMQDGVVEGSDKANVPLKVVNISKAFGGLQAVDGVSLTVRSGTIHALIGPNGSGKTTCIDCISGHLRPDAGGVWVGDASTTKAPHGAARAGIARTFQHPATIRSLSVGEEVALGAYQHKPVGYLQCLIRSRAHREHQRLAGRLAKHALEAVGLSRVADRASAGLSYGEMKRLGLARAIAQDPSFILVDEPSAGLAEQEARELGEVLIGLRESGAGVLLVDHNVGFVMSLADEVTVIDEGRVIAHGPPNEVRSDPRVVEAYLGQEAVR